MSYLLNFIYVLLIIAASPWLLFQSITKGKYREGFAAKVLGRVPQRASDGICLWLHAVSVGEVTLLVLLVGKIKEERPHWQCVISTTTMTGMALAKKKFAGMTVFYCPLDFSWAVAAAMRRIRPNVLVLAELELWPNLVSAARRSGAKVAVVNGRLSQHSFRGYCRIRAAVGILMRQIDLVAAQDETYAERFRHLGASPSTVNVTGSMKYDGAQTDRDNPATLRLIELAGFQPDDVVFLAGSTQHPEEELALETFRRLSPRWPRLRLVLVPRHPDRFDSVGRMLDEQGIPWQRRTELSPNDDGSDGGGERGKARVLLVDVIGELGAWWGTAAVAYVGGSMGSRGGQNMIEPAAYGAAVSFGPSTRNFRDIVDTMLGNDAAVVVENGEQLTQFVSRCLEDPSFGALLGQRAQTLVLRQLGATDRTFELLSALVEA